MFESINEGQLPQRATKYSAGFDVFANEDVVIGAGETKVIGLGISLSETKIGNWIVHTERDMETFLEHHYLELHPRSSLRAKGLGGGVGIIDMDYRDEIKMVIHNPLRYGQVPFNGDPNVTTIGIQHNATYVLKRGDKIGQLILKRHEGWLLPSEYTKDEERNGGFGSSGE